jgi:hypothetical protein
LAVRSIAIEAASGKLVEDFKDYIAGIAKYITEPDEDIRRVAAARQMTMLRELGVKKFMLQSPNLGKDLAQAEKEFGPIALARLRFALACIDEIRPSPAADQVELRLAEGIPEWSIELSREFLLALRRTDFANSKKIVPKLADHYDGRDRFYLAAIGIAVGSDPKRRELILADFDKQFPEWNDKVAELVWELRPPGMMPKLEEQLINPRLTLEQRRRVVEILAVYDNPDAGVPLLRLLTGDAPAELKSRAVDRLQQLVHTKWRALTSNEEWKSAIDRLLGDAGRKRAGLRLVAAARYSPALDQVARLAMERDPDAIRTLGH